MVEGELHSGKDTILVSVCSADQQNKMHVKNNFSNINLLSPGTKQKILSGRPRKNLPLRKKKKKERKGLPHVNRILQ